MRQLVQAPVLSQGTSSGMLGTCGRSAAILAAPVRHATGAARACSGIAMEWPRSGEIAAATFPKKSPVRPLGVHLLRGHRRLQDGLANGGALPTRPVVEEGPRAEDRPGAAGRRIGPDDAAGAANVPERCR